jgi:hypothetical protein
MIDKIKERLEKNNFNVIEIADGALLIENFISKKELEDLSSIIDNTPEEDWSIEYLKNLKDFCLDKFGRDDVDNLVAEGKFEVTRNWSDKNLSLVKYTWTEIFQKKLQNIIETVDRNLWASGLRTIQRMQKGVELVPHTDQHTDPSIQYATIIYLNENYNGGEFFFVNKNFSIKPKAGSLLFFPGTSEFEHGVKPVQDGPIRYVLVGFVKIKDFYKNNKY